MRKLQLAITTARTGGLILDVSSIAQNVTVEWGPHGPHGASCLIPGTLAASFRLYNRSSLPWLRLSDGARCIWAGRIEQVAVVSSGVEVHAFGAARGLSDSKYNAMWSVTSLETFTESWMISTIGGPTLLRAYEVDITAGAINIGLIKNTIYQVAMRGEAAYEIPNASSRNVAGFMVDYEFLASANTALRISAWPVGYPYASMTGNLFALAGNGALQKGSVFLGCNTPVITFGLICAVLHTYAGETGAEYCKFSNLRLVSLNSPVSSLTTATRTNGAGVTVTVGDTSWMYVDQRVWISGGGKTETTIVISISSSTTFTANINNAPGGPGYPIGTTVAAWAVYANDIAGDIASTADALRSAAQAFTLTPLRSSLSTSIGRIESPGRDLLDETYEDADRSAVLDYLTALGDTNTPPRVWRWWVDESQRVVFSPVRMVAQWPTRTWAIDIEDIELERDLDGLANNIYATYQDVDDRTLRTAAAQDMSSISTYGIVRQQVQATQTTQSAQATLERDTLLADRKTLMPRASFAIRQLYAINGARVALWELQVGDTLVVRNLPPGISSELDRVRRFRVTRVTLDVDARKISVEPESPIPALESLLSRLAAGSPT